MSIGFGQALSVDFRESTSCHAQLETYMRRRPSRWKALRSLKSHTSTAELMWIVRWPPRLVETAQCFCIKKDLQNLQALMTFASHVRKVIWPPSCRSTAQQKRIYERSNQICRLHHLSKNSHWKSLHTWGKPFCKRAKCTEKTKMTDFTESCTMNEYTRHTPSSLNDSL